MSRSDVTFTSTVEGEGHGADARLSCDEEETRKDGDADFKRFSLFTLVVFPESEFHKSSGSEIFLDQVVPPGQLKFGPRLARQNP